MAVKSDLPEILPALADVALIDVSAAAVAAGMSISQWQELVRRGEAPAAAIRESRFTRWLLSDVRRYLIERVARAQAQPERAAMLTSRAKMGSDAARVKREASRPAAKAQGDDVAPAR